MVHLGGPYCASLSGWKGQSWSHKLSCSVGIDVRSWRWKEEETFWLGFSPFFAAARLWQPVRDRLHGTCLLHVKCLSMPSASNELFPAEAVYVKLIEVDPTVVFKVLVGWHLVLSRGFGSHVSGSGITWPPHLSWCLIMMVAMLSTFDSSRTLMLVHFCFQMIRKIFPQHLCW